jgi:hypothetical protein
MEEYRRLCRREVNITMDLKEICVDVMTWTKLSQAKDYCRALLDKALNFQGT